MSKNDDGEFELVLGNRQLVSVFFVVVILLGAFFMMGYVVGRTSSTGGTVNADASRPSAAADKAIVVENGGRTAAPPVGVTDPNPSPTATQIEPRPPVESTKPSPIPATQPDAGAKRASPRKEEQSAREMRPETPAFQEPRPGLTFLQVAATSRADAEIVAESLSKRGFRTTIAPVPDSKLVRVLIGPIKDAADLVETRVKLEAASMKPMVRRY